MKLLRPLLLTTVLAALLGACGQKGPLYLPDSEAGQAPTAPAEQDEDEDGA